MEHLYLFASFCISIVKWLLVFVRLQTTHLKLFPCSVCNFSGLHLRHTAWSTLPAASCIRKVIGSNWILFFEHVFCFMGRGWHSSFYCHQMHPRKGCYVHLISLFTEYFIKHKKDILRFCCFSTHCAANHNLCQRWNFGFCVSFAMTISCTISPLNLQ